MKVAKVSKYQFLTAVIVSLFVVFGQGAIANQVLSLDGDGDYIDLGNKVPILGTKFTQEAWIYTQQVNNSYHGFIGFHADANNGKRAPSIWVYEKTKISYGFGDGSGFHWTITSSVLEENAWNHIAVTYDGTDYKFFINGKTALVYKGASGKVPISNPVKWIGKVDNYFKGKMDDVRIWNIVRTEVEIQATMKSTLTGNENGLVGYWNFDDGTAKDLTANRNDGEFKGDAKVVDPDPNLVFPNSKGLSYESDDHTLGLWHFDEGSGHVVTDSSKNKAIWNANVGWNKTTAGRSFCL